MKITSIINVSVLGKKSTIAESTGKESYSLAILQGNEAGNISCVKDVFDAVKPLNSYSVTSVYDDRYQYMRVTAVDLRSEKPMYTK